MEGKVGAGISEPLLELCLCSETAKVVAGARQMEGVSDCCFLAARENSRYLRLTSTHEDGKTTLKKE